MNLELQGALTRLRNEKMELTVKAKALIKSIKHLLATAAITPLEDLDIESVEVQARELKQAYKDYLKIKSKIDEIEKELDGGF
jgi:flagellar biosynthesis chaperone FliJ